MAHLNGRMEIKDPMACTGRERGKIVRARRVVFRTLSKMIDGVSRNLLRSDFKVVEPQTV